jgi:hypothetical protein
MAPLKAMLTELKALNDECTGGQALNYFAEKSYCPSLDDSPKLTKNQLILQLFLWFKKPNPQFKKP